jgi:hypothetical protein
MWRLGAPPVPPPAPKRPQIHKHVQNCQRNKLETCQQNGHSKSMPQGSTVTTLHPASNKNVMSPSIHCSVFVLVPLACNAQPETCQTTPVSYCSIESHQSCLTLWQCFSVRWFLGACPHASRASAQTYKSKSSHIISHYVWSMP